MYFVDEDLYVCRNVLFSQRYVENTFDV